MAARGVGLFFFNSPELCSGWAIVITFHLSINIFKWLLLWSRWASFAQISCGASLGWGSKRLLKWSWSIDPRWPPCTYMVKTFKNLLHNRGCLGAEFLQESLWQRGLPKLLYSTAFTKVISFALHDKKFCSLARNKRGMSVGLARV